MLNNIFVGFYLYFSALIASLLLVHSLVGRAYSLTEKVIFSYLSFVAFIIIIIRALDVIPQGVTSTNTLALSQAYLALSLIIAVILKGKTFLVKIKPHLTQLILKIPRNKVLILAVLIFLLDVLASIWAIYLFPVNEGDSLSYHLQSAPNWYQAKNLTIFPTNDFRSILFPDNQNLLVLWNFFSFKSDHLIEIIPYFYLLLSVAAIFAFLQKLQKNTFLNFLLALLFYYVGTHLIYVKTFSGDIGVAALTITSLTLLYSYLKDQKFVYFLFFTLSNGLLLGIKTPGLLSVATLYLFAMIYEIWVHKKRWSFGMISKYLLSMTFCFSLGGYQYIQNWQYFHNPFYPKKINLLNLISLPGISEKVMGAHGFSLVRTIQSLISLIRSAFQGAFGYQFPLFYFPAFVTLLLFYRRKISRSTRFIALFLVISNSLFLLTFLGAATRYFFDIGFVGILLLADFLKIQKEKIQSSFTLLIALFILLALAGSGTLLRLDELAHLSTKPPQERQLGNLFYDDDFYLFQKEIPYKTTIVYLLPENSLVYPFYGPSYENRLIYANSYRTDEIVELIQKEKARFLIAKSLGSTYGSYFYYWGKQTGPLVEFPEEYAKSAVIDLSNKGYIDEIGQSTRLAFYRINEEILK